MKRTELLCQSMFLLAAAVAHASPVVTFTQFTESIFYGTDTFETAGGAVLSTVQFVGWGDEIPPDIAASLASDPSFPGIGGMSDPAGAAFIQSTASQAALTTDLEFLSGQLPTVFLTSATPTAYVGALSNVNEPEFLLETLFPGFVFDDPIAAFFSLGTTSYSTGAFDASSDTILDGTVNFDTFEIDIISQPAAATPEP